MHQIEQYLAEAGLTPYLTAVDIETPGSRNTSAVLTIGAVTVNMVAGTIASEFYLRCRLEGQDANGLTSDDDTIEWWNQIKQQGQPGLDAFLEAWGELPRWPLAEALEAFNTYLHWHYTITKQAQLFGCGPEFDNTILEHACRQLRINPGWTFRGNQSVRTVLLLSNILFGKVTDPIRPDNIPHHALHDARREALTVLRLIHRLRQRLGGE